MRSLFKLSRGLSVCFLLVGLLQAEELILDNERAVLNSSETDWASSTGAWGCIGSDYIHDGNTSATPKSVTFTTGVSDITATYRVFCRWTSHPNRALRRQDTL